VLISQNCLSREAEYRADLDMHIGADEWSGVKGNHETYLDIVSIVSYGADGRRVLRG